MITRPLIKNTLSVTYFVPLESSGSERAHANAAITLTEPGCHEVFSLKNATASQCPIIFRLTDIQSSVRMSAMLDAVVVPSLQKFRSWIFNLNNEFMTDRSCPLHLRFLICP